MVMVSSIHTAIRIPKQTPQIQDLAERFRALKLSALQTDSQNLSGEYESESVLPLSAWEHRLTRSGVETIVAVASSTPPSNIEDQLASLLQSEWIGMITMIGPTPFEEFFLPATGQPMPGPDGTETRWHMTALYISPGCRGKGIAKQLISTAIAIGRAYSQAQGAHVKTRFRLFVAPNNVVAIKLYGGLGFQAAGKVTLEEAFIANGNREGLPEIIDPARFRFRQGISMEYLT